MNEEIQEKELEEKDIKEQVEEADEEIEEVKEPEMMEISVDEYESVVQEAKDFKDKYMRLYAEFDNARKRMEKDKQDFVKYSNQNLLTDFLEIFDNLERSTLALLEQENVDSNLLKGFEMVLKQASKFLSDNHVEHIDSVGKPLDVSCHEILMQEETDEYEEGTVLEEYQKGYKYYDAVLRTAKVKVAAKSKPAMNEEN